MVLNFLKHKQTIVNCFKKVMTKFVSNSHAEILPLYYVKLGLNILRSLSLVIFLVLKIRHDRSNRIVKMLLYKPYYFKIADY